MQTAPLPARAAANGPAPGRQQAPVPPLTALDPPPMPPSSPPPSGRRSPSPYADAVKTNLPEPAAPAPILKRPASPAVAPDASAASRNARRRKRQREATQVPGMNGPTPRAIADREQRTALREPVLWLRFEVFFVDWIQELLSKLLVLAGYPANMDPNHPSCPFENFSYTEDSKTISFAVKDRDLLARLLTTSLVFHGMQIGWTTRKGTLHPIGIIAAPSTATPRHLNAALRKYGTLSHLTKATVRKIHMGDWLGFLQMPEGAELPKHFQLNGHDRPTRIIPRAEFIRCKVCGAIANDDCACKVLARLKAEKAAQAQAAAEAEAKEKMQAAQESGDEADTEDADTAEADAADADTAPREHYTPYLESDAIVADNAGSDARGQAATELASMDVANDADAAAQAAPAPEAAIPAEAAISEADLYMDTDSGEDYVARPAHAANYASDYSMDDSDRESVAVYPTELEELQHDQDFPPQVAGVIPVVYSAAAIAQSRPGAKRQPNPESTRMEQDNGKFARVTTRSMAASKQPMDPQQPTASGNVGDPSTDSPVGDAAAGPSHY